MNLMLSNLPAITFTVYVTQVVVLAGQVLFSRKGLCCPLERVDANTAWAGCFWVTWLLLDYSSQAGRKHQEGDKAQHGELTER